MSTLNDEGLPYSDGNWHHVVVRRAGRTVFIYMDEDWIGDVRTVTTTFHLVEQSELKSPLTHGSSLVCSALLVNRHICHVNQKSGFILLDTSLHVSLHL